MSTPPLPHWSKRIILTLRCVNFILFSLRYNDLSSELAIICDVECKFNASLPGFMITYVFPLVALVFSKRSTVDVARRIIQMLGPNSGKLIAMFNSHLFRRPNDRNGSGDAEDKN